MTGPIIKAALLQAIDGLDVDELRVLVQIAKRLQLGQRQYGALRISSDPRNFRREFAEEMLDGAVYASILALQEPAPIDYGRDEKKGGR